MTVESYEELVAGRAPALLRLAFMLTGRMVDAEDLLQTTFLRAHPHQERIARMDAPAAYLRRVMVNEHLGARRLALRRPRLVSPEEHEPTTTVDDYRVVDSRDATWRALAHLPKRQRAVLVMRYYEDLPDQEIADVLRCTSGTVRSQAFRGLATLRAHLDAQDQETRP